MTKANSSSDADATGQHAAQKSFAKNTATDYDQHFINDLIDRNSTTISTHYFNTVPSITAGIHTLILQPPQA